QLQQASSVLSTAPATPPLSTLSLPDALPICRRPLHFGGVDRTEQDPDAAEVRLPITVADPPGHRRGCLLVRHGARRPEQRDYQRSEEHTSELQSRENLVCRLLLEKKNADTTD